MLNRRQSMWTITEETVCLEGKQVVSYGISCGGVVINDISANKQEMSEFTELLNKMNASEIHAYELVEDFLGK